MVDLLPRLVTEANEARYEIYYEIFLGGRFAQQIHVLHQRYGELRVY